MKQKKQKNKKRNRYPFMVSAVILVAMLGTLLPGWLLLWQSGEQVNMVDAVPAEYYSPANLAVARNASANLGVYQKLQLITGKWESNTSPADEDETELESYQAIELAKEQIDALYQIGAYPSSLLSNYENWYSWEAELCKVVDATFNTYAAYYWKLEFVKYDGSEKHSVYMLEDGTVFLAEAWQEKGADNSTLSPISILNENSYLGLSNIVSLNPKEDNGIFEEALAFAGVETEELQWLDWAQLNVGERKYQTFQLQSAGRYLYSLLPKD